MSIQNDIDRANRRARAQAFVSELADILDQGELLGFDEEQIERAQAAAERARAAYFGTDGRDIATKRVGWVFEKLHWARSVVDAPIAENARHTVAAAAQAIVESRGIPDTGLEQISVGEWQTAIERFRALAAPGFEGWSRVVFDLLSSHGLTNASTHDNMRKAWKTARERGDR